MVTALSPLSIHPPFAPYSHGIEVPAGWRLVFCSGQVGIDPSTGDIVPGGIEAETERVLKNLGAVLDAAGCSFADVVKTTCFLADIADFATFNTIYARFFPDPPPARSTFQVAALPKGARVEVEAVAVRDRA